MTMKLRNRLIALVCLFIFLAIGAFLLLSSSSRKPFAIILFIGDNITSPVLGAARLFNGGAEARLQLEDFPYSAMSRNAANDFSIPDAASASTEIAAGVM
jgi:alkaline phosphatase